MPTQPYKTADGKRVPGVTTVIGNCKIGGIDGLLYWANRLGMDGKDFRGERDKAADAGTCAHEMVDCAIRQVQFDMAPYTKEILKLAEPAYMAYLKWADSTKLSVFESELPLVSEKYRYGGTMDAIMVDGELSMGDWKTSNSIHVDYLCQLAAYKQL